MAKNWYPVIDEEKCIRCDACFNKCSKGVYEKKEDNMIVVIYPEGCVDQCRGCQSLCPADAIEYYGDLSSAQNECCNNAESTQNTCCDNSGNNYTQKNIAIDFLYLDLSICERCQGTDTTLDEAIDAVKTVLEVTGMQVQLNKINVISEALAIEYRFVSSPTIRINGQDIQLEVKENACKSCGDLCGEDVDCRVWLYKVKEYTVPPKAMIVEAILKAVYGKEEAAKAEEAYTIPSNLKQFYVSMKQNIV